mmetsp:Transcript_2480/g.4845  ORF Transcript_2480/g.4845 Transcript_2480/m.4845 type:complete len:474 (+) Transcript_2480:82-1503(+)
MQRLFFAVVALSIVTLFSVFKSKDEQESTPKHGVEEIREMIESGLNQTLAQHLEILRNTTVTIATNNANRTPSMGSLQDVETLQKQISELEIMSSKLGEIKNFGGDIEGSLSRQKQVLDELASRHRSSIESIEIAHKNLTSHLERIENMTSVLRKMSESPRNYLDGQPEARPIDNTRRVSGEQKEKRILVLMAGQSARVSNVNTCNKRGKINQRRAAKSQMDNVFYALEKAGYGVDLFLITNNCSESWEQELRTMYSPFLRHVVVAPNEKGLGKLFQRGAYIGLGIVEIVRTLTNNMSIPWLAEPDKIHRFPSTMTLPDSPWSHVIITRPDMFFLDPSHAPGFVNKGDAIVYPFKCEKFGWQNIRCIADTIIGMPFKTLFEWDRKCLGRHMCFESRNLPPRREDDFDPPKYPNETIRKFGLKSHLELSGHGCVLCMEEMWNNEDRPPLEFILDEHLGVNARFVWNPIFLMNAG